MLEFLDAVLDELLLQFLPIFLVEGSHPVFRLEGNARGVHLSKVLVRLGQDIGDRLNDERVIDVVILRHHFATHDGADMALVTRFLVERYSSLINSGVN